MQADVTTVPEQQVTVPSRPPRGLWETRVVVITILVVGLALSAVVLLALRNKLPTSAVGTATTIGGPPTYPVGIADAAEPSGMAPPAANALAGYHLTYVADFLGGSLPSGWATFTGQPGGVPNGQFASSHVHVSGGLLRLVTYRDPAFKEHWTTGGLCQCARHLLYAAVFVRSRISGPGTNEVELLWPPTNIWPPEVDFNETGPRDTSTSWTVHWGAHNSIFQRTLTHVDMTKWHTWGIIWTPSSLTFTFDGVSWGTFTDAGAVPHVPMTLDIQQRPACRDGIICTAQAQTMLVDWVAEYQR